MDLGSSTTGIAIGCPHPGPFHLRTAAKQISDEGKDARTMMPTALLLDRDLNVLEFGRNAEQEFNKRFGKGVA